MNVIDIVGTLQGILDQNAEVALKIQAVISEVMRSEVSLPKLYKTKIEKALSCDGQAPGIGSKDELPLLTKEWVDDLIARLEYSLRPATKTPVLLPASLSDLIPEEVKAYAAERGLHFIVDDRAVEIDVKSGGNYSLSFTQTDSSEAIKGEDSLPKPPETIIEKGLSRDDLEGEAGLKEEYPPLNKKWVEDLIKYFEKTMGAVRKSPLIIPRLLSGAGSEEVIAYATERGLKIFIDDRAVEIDVKNTANDGLDTSWIAWPDREVQPDPPEAIKGGLK